MAKGIFSRWRDTRGFNLIEATIALGIAGLVFSAVWAAWGNVTTQNKIRKATEMVTLIVQQIRGAHAARSTLVPSSVSGATFTDALVNAEILPREWQVASGAVQNPWNGNLVITPEQTSSGLYDGINISMTAIQKADCLKLVSNVLGNARAQGLYKIDSITTNGSTKFSDVSGTTCTSTTLNLYFTLKANN